MSRGDLFASVWSRPGAQVFQQEQVHIPGPFSFTKRMAGGVGQGDITVPTDWEFLNDVIQRVPGSPTSDIRRQVIVNQEDTSGAAKYAYSYFLDVTGDELSEREVKISGPGIESIMADAIVYPWDWDGLDQSTSTFPDWIWGGKDIVGPVLTRFAPHIFDLWNTGTSGSFQLGVSADGAAFQYTTIQFNDTATAVETAVEALANVLDAKVEGSGTEANPWRIEIVSPSATYTVAIGPTSLGGGGVARLSLLQFGVLTPVGWTQSLVDNTNVPHGVLTDFRASLGGGSDPVLPAGCDAWVVFLGQEFYFPGIQTRRKVVPGGIYQVEPLQIYAQGASALVRIVIRDINENLIAFEEVNIPSNTLTASAGIANVMIPDGVTEIIYRIGHIGPGTPPRIFVACPNM